MKKQLLLTSALLAASGVAFAGGRSTGKNLSDLFLETQPQSSQSAGGIAMMATLENEELCEIPEPESRALIVTSEINPDDPGTFTEEQLIEAQQKFSFEKTLNQIIATSGSADTSASKLLTDIYDSLDEPSITVDGNTFDLQERNTEAGLAGFADEIIVNDAIKLSAVVNRFDLASIEGEHCGEYRLVYHTASFPSRSFNTFFFIFEAQYPNPLPSLGVAGCAPIANFWLSLDGLTKAEAATKLQEFYYEGVVSDGIWLDPVINFAAFTENSGQIRTNAFINSPWNLREFKATIDSENKTTLEVASVKSNPLAELFTGESSTDLDSQFLDDFSTTYINNLIEPELKAIENGDDISTLSKSTIINGIHLSNDDIFNEFQSDSLFAESNPIPGDNTSLLPLSQEMSDTFAQALTQLPEGYTLQMLRNRAEAMSCGGCHQTVTDLEVAPGVKWPKSLTFLHIDEDGRTSDGLKQEFLPFRAEVLADFACKTPKPFEGENVMIVHKALGLALTEEATCDTTSANGDPITAVPPGSINDCGTWVIEHKDDGYFFLKNAVTNRPISPATDGQSVEPVLARPTNWDGDWVTWYYVPVEENFGYLKHKYEFSQRPLFMPGDGSDAAMVGGVEWDGDWVRWNIFPVE